MNTFEQAVAEIEVYGFTLIPEVLSPDQVKSLKQALIEDSPQQATGNLESMEPRQ